MNYFIFNEINSKDMGIIINKMPNVIKSERRINSIEIPGKDGNLHEDEETYKTKTITIECTLLEREKLDDVIGWLDGTGTLVLSNDPNKMYRAAIINQIDFSPIVNILHTFPLQIELQPISYSTELYIKEFEEGEDFEINISEATAKIRPLIILYGSGNLVLTINNEIVNIKLNDNDSITIDCDLALAYKDEENCNNKILGDLENVFLKRGVNQINLTGTYTKIQFKYRKAYL